MPGDRIWVRETWKTSAAYDDLAPSEMGGEEGVKYLADSGVETWGWAEPIWGKTRTSIHMPRWASRITLVVNDVRVERLQDISERDAEAEGVSFFLEEDDPMPWGDMTAKDRACMVRTSYGSHTKAFNHLWDSLNAKRAPWSSNPWVMAISYTPYLCNIDQMENAA